MVDALEVGLAILEEKQNESSLWIAATDTIAVGLLKAAHAKKIAIPNELSITGFGGYDISDFVYPALSTVHFHYIEAGEKSFEDLYQLIQGNAIPRKTTIPFDIYHRDSVSYRGSN